MADEIIFLGTGGARIVVFKQIRASGGIWLSLAQKNILIDPGPGSLVRLTSNRNNLDPTRLDAVLLSHRHLDHSADINSIVEAITEGGLKKRGKLFTPEDALENDDPVVLRYLRGFLDEIIILKEGQSYSLDTVSFSTPIRHQHRGETYGFLFKTEKIKIAYIADTRYFEALAQAYQADLVIFNVIRLDPAPFDHLTIPDVKELMKKIKPRLAVLTHFGMSFIKAKPWEVAAQVEAETGIKTIAARDGMKLSLEDIENVRRETGKVKGQ
jgi:ribonuclease BN (tRNA processing enzyme)